MKIQNQEFKNLDKSRFLRKSGQFIWWIKPNNRRNK